MEPRLSTTIAQQATASAGDQFTSVDELERGLHSQRYVAERGLATTLYLTLKLGKPLLLEGEAGVGKTEIAKVLADLLETPLIRLQCYEGLDAATAIYEWDYPRQMLYLRTLEVAGGVNTEAARRGGATRRRDRRVRAAPAERRPHHGARCRRDARLGRRTLRARLATAR